MGNLIRAEFYRLRRRPHSVLGMALILLLKSNPVHQGPTAPL